MVSDLLLSHPSPDNLHIVPTARDAYDNLALSSRNAYLSPSGRKVAPVLYASLRAAEDRWAAGASKHECINTATEVIQQCIERTNTEGLDVQMKPDYIEMNTVGDFQVVADDVTRSSMGEVAVILSGALWVDQTRLIDNILLGSVDNVVQ